MKLVLEQVQPKDVVLDEEYLILVPEEIEGWVVTVATSQGWAFNTYGDVIDLDRKWPKMIFQCPRKGRLVED